MINTLLAKARSFFTLLLLISAAGQLYASIPAAKNDTKLLDYYHNDSDLVLKTTEGFLRIQTLDNKSVIGFSFAKDSIFIAASDAVIQKNIPTFFMFRQTATELDVRMGDLYYSINKDPLEIKINTGQDNRDQLVMTGPFTGPTGSGLCIQLDTREKIMGGGARAININRRGKILQLSNQANPEYSWGTELLNYSLPVFYSSKKYLIFFDAPQRATADIGATRENNFRIESQKESFNYYVITGSDYQNILKKLSRLTGTQPLPPLWVLGKLQSSDHYRSQSTLTQAVDSMSNAKHAPDAVLLDQYWFGRGKDDSRMGNLSWDQERWSTPLAMMKNLQNKGIKTLLLTEPAFLTSTAHYQAAAAQGFFGQNESGKPFVIEQFPYGQTSLIDVFNPEACDWLWTKYQPLIESGVKGWWSNLSAPEKHPDNIHYRLGRSQDLHNIYSHYWAKILSDRYHKHYPEKRLFNSVSAGYVGSQRYSIFPNSGNVESSWDGLRAQLPIMLTMSMSGIPYMHHTAGGAKEGRVDEELYTRWVQLSVFSPIYRIHEANQSAVPANYSNETQKIIQNFNELRYQLTPYIYTLSYRQTVYGEPLVRPLIYEQSDDYLVDIYDTYYFGKNMLVAPVLEPGKTSRKVELPLGAWFHYFSGTLHLGGRTVEVPTPRNEIPLFIKAGSFIPSIPLQPSLDAFNTDQIFLTYYHHESVENSKDELYIDCGINAEAIEKGTYQLFSFEAQYSGKDLNIDISHNNGIYLLRPGRRTIVLQINNFNQRPEQVRIDKKNVDFHYDTRRKQIQVKFPMEADPVNIRIR